MKLPNLDAWTTEQGPPQVSDLIRHGVPDGVTSLFPSLTTLDLRSRVAFEWLSLFEAAKGRTPPWIMAGDSLPMINYHHPTLQIDSSLVSRFLPFTGITELRIMTDCTIRGPCISQYTDEDAEGLAIALPKLEALTLGESPCSAGTCPTTIRSLLSFSIHCTKLRYLNIHFRTATLRADMWDLLGDAYSQGLHLRPKCALTTLVTQGMPLELSDDDLSFILMGMLMIFPSLGEFVSRRSSAWAELDFMVKGFGPFREKIGFKTEQLMKSIALTRALVDGEASPVSPHPALGFTGDHR